MRLFTAIPVDDAVVNHAAALRSELAINKPDVKWVEKENYHLTLKFLGEVQPALLLPLKERLTVVAESCPPFSLQLSTLGFFPNRNRPRIIWAGIRGEMDKAEFLGERIDAFLADLGFEPERRRSFHLTLGRVRSERGLSELQTRAASSSQSREVLEFRVEEFYLMESKLSQRGPSYEILEKYILNGY